MQEISCFKCHKVWAYDNILARAAECPDCRADAHTCHNCQFYDRAAHHECREEQAEFVQEKERANFCDYFSPISRRTGSSKETDLAKQKLASLFSARKETEASEATTKPSSLEDELQRFLSKK